MQGNTDAGIALAASKQHPAYEPFLQQFRTDCCDARTRPLARQFEDTAFAVVKLMPAGDDRIRVLRKLLDLRDLALTQVSPVASSTPLA